MSDFAEICWFEVLFVVGHSISMDTVQTYLLFVVGKVNKTICSAYINQKACFNRVTAVILVQ